jgi:hypothetical protein
VLLLLLLLLLPARELRAMQMKAVQQHAMSHRARGSQRVGCAGALVRHQLLTLLAGLLVHARAQVRAVLERRFAYPTERASTASVASVAAQRRPGPSAACMSAACMRADVGGR